MCTAVTYNKEHFYLGRTLDYEIQFGEAVTVMPRRFPLPYRHLASNTDHYAIIGMAHIADGYPLYYDAMNEKGLVMAGLNFVGNAVYGQPQPGKDNIASFELIPWVLSQCENLTQAKRLMKDLWLTEDTFSSQLPLAQLHWIIADRTGAITVEMTAAGLQIYENPLGVLANNPAFPEQLLHLSDFMQLSAGEAENRFAPAIKMDSYSRGMGAIGLPGDLSSRSRFVRAAFGKLNSVSHGGYDDCRQIFHILGTVAQIRGCCRLGEGTYEITQYACCCDADAGVYYYTTYGNSRISGVDMYREDLDSHALISYDLEQASGIVMQNKEAGSI